ncbi:hypothetical protein PENTCL1PPCAC_8027, partial [Pristionchus entomophagus]
LLLLLGVVAAPLQCFNITIQNDCKIKVYPYFRTFPEGNVYTGSMLSGQRTTFVYPGNNVTIRNGATGKTRTSLLLEPEVPRSRTKIDRILGFDIGMAIAWAYPAKGNGIVPITCKDKSCFAPANFKFSYIPSYSGGFRMIFCPAFEIFA